jgi:hypothetical protein
MQISFTIYEGCSNSNDSYYIMLAHDVRGGCWWYVSRGQTFLPEVRKFCCHATEFLHVEKALTDIHQCLLNVSGDQTVDVSTVRWWVVYFSSGDSNLRDRPCSRWPCTAVRSMKWGAPWSAHLSKSADYNQGTFECRIQSVGNDWQCCNISSLCQVGPTDTSLKTKGHVAKFGWTVLPHPPYSPDLTPSNFHLFWTLKDAVRKWFTSDGVDFYKHSMKAVTRCWWKCIASGDGYVEQQCFVSENLLYPTTSLCTLYLL